MATFELPSPLDEYAALAKDKFFELQDQAQDHFETLQSWIYDDDQHSRFKATLAIALFFFTVEFLSFYLISPIARRIFRRNKALSEKELDSIASGFAVRIACNVHNFHQCWLALRVISNEALQKNMFFGTTADSTLCLSITAGFFVYDLLVSLRDVRTEGVAFVVHGALCCAVYMYGYLSGYFNWFGAFYVLWEASTPLVHLRWALFNLGMADSALYLLNGIAMALVFFAFRIAAGYYVSYLFIKGLADMFFAGKMEPLNPTSIWLYIVGCVVLNALNTIWFATMIGKIISYSKKLFRMILGGGGKSSKRDKKDKKKQ